MNFPKDLNKSFITKTTNAVNNFVLVKINSEISDAFTSCVTDELPLSVSKRASFLKFANAVAELHGYEHQTIMKCARKTRKLFLAYKEHAPLDINFIRTELRKFFTVYNVLHS